MANCTQCNFSRINLENNTRECAKLNCGCHVVDFGPTFSNHVHMAEPDRGACPGMVNDGSDSAHIHNWEASCI